MVRMLGRFGRLFSAPASGIQKILSASDALALSQAPADSNVIRGQQGWNVTMSGGGWTVATEFQKPNEVFAKAIPVSVRQTVNGSPLSAFDLPPVVVTGEVIQAIFHKGE